MVLHPASIWLAVTYPRRRICGCALNRCLVMGDHSMLSHHGMAELMVHLKSLGACAGEHRQRQVTRERIKSLAGRRTEPVYGKPGAARRRNQPHG